MRIAINHETIYRYDSPASLSVQYLRLTPKSGPNQRVLSWRLNAPAPLRTWTDAHGNLAHILVIDKPHQEIRITAIGEVESLEEADILMAEDETHPAELYLRSSRLTEASTPLRHFADKHRETVRRDRRAGLGELMHELRESVTYRPGITHSATSAAEAFTAGAGVCQDHAHLFIACCRALDIPARYVSGYLCTSAAGEEGMASHAWAEAWMDDEGWLSYDVANRRAAGEAHVRLAVGMDYLDACPVRGVRRGGAGESLVVEVNVNDARQQQQ